MKRRVLTPPVIIARRNQTPPEIARRYGVATSKVIEWIRSGELESLNLARRNCKRPRYSVTPEALERFEQARTVVPDASDVTTRKPLRRKLADVKKFF